MDYADDIESAVNETDPYETLNTKQPLDLKIINRDIIEEPIKNKNHSKYENNFVDIKKFFGCKDVNVGNDSLSSQSVSTKPPPFSSTYPNGALILEIIDEGVGMEPDDYKKLFKSIVQFNPSELQVQFSYKLNIFLQFCLL